MSKAEKLYQTHIRSLPLELQLEILELIIQTSFKKFKRPVKPNNEFKDTELTDLQKLMLSVPVMSDEDFEIYQSKRN